VAYVSYRVAGDQLIDINTGVVVGYRGELARRLIADVTGESLNYDDYRLPED
jgi:hypothetical protein